MATKSADYPPGLSEFEKFVKGLSPDDLSSEIEAVLRRADQRRQSSTKADNRSSSKKQAWPPPLSAFGIIPNPVIEVLSKPTTFNHNIRSTPNDLSTPSQGWDYKNNSDTVTELEAEEEALLRDVYKGTRPFEVDDDGGSNGSSSGLIPAVAIDESSLMPNPSNLILGATDSSMIPLYDDILW